MKIPSCGPHEIRVRVRACALDELDLRVRQGKFKSFVTLPMVPGFQISGSIVQAGSSVRGLSEGDQIVAIIPLDAKQGGFAEYVIINSICAVKKPPKVSFEDAAASLLDGLRVYHMLHYLAYIRPSQFVCIIGGTAAINRLLIQNLALIKDCKVIIVGNGESDTNAYASHSHIVRVIDPRNESIISCLLEETGGLGVDIVFDLQNYDMSSPIHQGSLKGPKPTVELKTRGHSRGKSEELKEEVEEEIPSDQFIVPKTVIIRCLGVHAKWCTSSNNLQIEPHESMQLSMRSASICFLFEQSWLLSPRYHGRYLHILGDLMENIEKEKLRPLIAKTAKLEDIRSVYRHIHHSSSSGKVVITMPAGKSESSGEDFTIEMKKADNTVQRAKQTSALSEALESTGLN
ncbi:hypothetical protein AAMO2058_001085000 [Amorphochlora amoebiformis]